MGVMLSRTWSPEKRIFFCRLVKAQVSGTVARGLDTDERVASDPDPVTLLKGRQLEGKAGVVPASGMAIDGLGDIRLPGIR